MSGRLDWYFRQKVTEAELDLGFSLMEDADRAFAVDGGTAGVVQGGAATQRGAGANLTVDIAAGVAYDKLGQRISWSSLQNVNCAVDESSVSTAVVTPGSYKAVSIYAKFVRVLTDPRIDGNSATVFFNVAEGFQFVVRQGGESVSNPPTPAALDATYVLIADVLLAYGQTTIVNANINALLSGNRREDAFATTSTPRSVRRGVAKDAVADLLGYYNSHVTGIIDKHTAISVTYAGSGAWKDATTVSSTNVESALDEVVSDLAGTAGAAKVGTVATGNWADATSVVAGSVQSAVNGIVSALAATSGSIKVGSAALANWADGTTMPAGTVQSQLAAIVAALVSNSGLRGAGKVSAPPVTSSPLSLAATTVSGQINELLTGLNAFENQKAAASGLAPLDSGSDVPYANLPGVKIVDVQTLFASNLYGSSVHPTYTSMADLTLANCLIGDIIVVASEADITLPSADDMKAYWFSVNPSSVETAVSQLHNWSGPWSPNVSGGGNQPTWSILANFTINVNGTWHAKLENAFVAPPAGSSGFAWVRAVAFHLRPLPA